MSQSHRAPSPRPAKARRGLTNSARPFWQVGKPHFFLVGQQGHFDDDFDQRPTCMSRIDEAAMSLSTRSSFLFLSAPILTTNVNFGRAIHDGLLSLERLDLGQGGAKWKADDSTTRTGCPSRRMLSHNSSPLQEFLTGSFSRVGKKTAEEVCRKASLDCRKDSASLSADEQKRLIENLQATKIPPPPVAVCLSPIGEELITRGIEKEFELDFIRARTRPGSVYSGQPFLVEAAIGYGGNSHQKEMPPSSGLPTGPLMYQQGACAITQSIAHNWKTYGIPSPVSRPVRCSSWSTCIDQRTVHEREQGCHRINPRDREGDCPRLQELGRDLKLYLSRRDRNRLQEDRAVRSARSSRIWPKKWQRSSRRLLPISRLSKGGS